MMSLIFNSLSHESQSSMGRFLASCCGGGTAADVSVPKVELHTYFAVNSARSVICAITIILVASRYTRAPKRDKCRITIHLTHHLKLIYQRKQDLQDTIPAPDGTHQGKRCRSKADI